MPKAEVAGEGKLAPKDSVWKYKQYVCKAKCFDITAGGKIIVLNETEAHENDLYTSHRVILRSQKAQTVAIIDVSSDLVGRGEVVLFSEVASELGAMDGNEIEIMHMQRPASIEFIKKKMDGRTLAKREIDTVMR